MREGKKNVTDGLSLRPFKNKGPLDPVPLRPRAKVSSSARRYRLRALFDKEWGIRSSHAVKRRKEGDILGVPGCCTSSPAIVWEVWQAVGHTLRAAEKLLLRTWKDLVHTTRIAGGSGQRPRLTSLQKRGPNASPPTWKRSTTAERPLATRGKNHGQIEEKE